MADPTAKITAAAVVDNADNAKRKDLIVTGTVNVNGVDVSRTVVIVADDQFIFHMNRPVTAEDIQKQFVLEANKLQALHDIAAALGSNMNTDLVAASKGK